MKPMDIVYLGLGAAYLAKDRFDGLLKQLEDKGEVSREELKKLADEARERGEKERSRFESEIKAKVKEAVSEMGLATKEDVEELKKLIKKS